ncbi:hypothetical protein FRC17_007562 [Serendipita sp. 399]|nr:hypothetical protein FRC17_007562 [Serendipita sp. 399]
MQTTEEERIASFPIYLVAFSLYWCIIELGISLGDGGFGRWSLWMAPPASIITFIVIFIIIYISGETEQKRRGTMILPFVYSYTVAAIWALLTLLWIAVSVVICIRIHKLDPQREVVRAEAAFAIINAISKAAEGIGFVYYRSQFHKLTIIGATNVVNTRTPANNDRPLPAAPVPPLQFPPQPVNPVNPNVVQYPYSGVNPLYLPANSSVTATVPNPVYQPPTTTITTPVYPMMQKDAGK